MTGENRSKGSTETSSKVAVSVTQVSHSPKRMPWLPHRQTRYTNKYAHIKERKYLFLLELVFVNSRKQEMT